MSTPSPGKPGSGRYGNPYDGPTDRASGLAGAVLGSILLGEEPDGGPPAGFGGPDTRERRRLPRE
ncbi:hypothetical protein ACWGI9_22120 [Streptomyces sp. NPDC054833]